MLGLNTSFNLKKTQVIPVPVFKLFFFHHEILSRDTVKACVEEDPLIFNVNEMIGWSISGDEMPHVPLVITHPSLVLFLFTPSIKRW